MRTVLIFVSVLAFVPQACVAQSNDARSRLGDGTSEVLDMVLAAVDGEPLTLEDLKTFILSQGELPAADVRAGKFDINRYFPDFLTQRLLEKEAKAAGITVSDDEIRAYIEEIKKQNHVDDAGFAKLLGSRGLTVDGYKKQVISDITRTRIVSSRVRSRVNVSDQDVTRYVADHPEIAPVGGTVHLHQIFVSANPDGRDAARKKAGEIRAEASDLDELRKVGGDDYTDLGFVNASDLITDLQKIAEKLEVGTVSDVIDTEKGSYLLLVSQKNESETPQIDAESKEEIKKKLLEERLHAELDAYVRDELPKKYHVEIKF